MVYPYPGQETHMTVATIPDTQIQPTVLLISLVFAPDGVSTAILLTELAGQLHQRGHPLVVVTTTPHYNQDADSLNAQPLHPCWGSFLMQSVCRILTNFYIFDPPTFY